MPEVVRKYRDNIQKTTHVNFPKITSIVDFINKTRKKQQNKYSLNSMVHEIFKRTETEKNFYFIKTDL